MTQETHFCFNQQEWSEISPGIGTPYGYQLDLDLVKYVDDIDTIRRLDFKKRSREASPASEPQSIIRPTHWTSSDSLSSVSSDEAKKTSLSLLSSSASINRRRPPLPHHHSKPKSSSKGPEVCQGLSAHQRDSDGTPPPATQNLPSTTSNPLVEKTLVETCKRLEHEKGPPEPHSRRRLASFGGLGSSGSQSPYTSLGGLNQHRTQGVYKGAKMTVLDSTTQGTMLMGNSHKISPSSSGRASPVSSVSPLHLQMVRDQMAAALQRLKDLEEQVKAIPVLQVKILVLQEEKKQLTALVKGHHGQKSEFNLSDEVKESNKESSEDMEGWEHSANSGLMEFKQLGVEMQLLEKKIQDACIETRQSSSFGMRDSKYVAVGDDNFREGVGAKLQTKSVAVSVTETMLGVVSDKETQQQTIQLLSDRIQTLEAELKEAEMGRLRSELLEAEARNRSPQVNCTATQTGLQTRTIGVGNHTHFVHSCVGVGPEQISNDVGVSCTPNMRAVSSGPDSPMEDWEVHKRVERKDQCVGSMCMPTCSQGVGTTVRVCDAGTMTLETLEKRSISCQTVGSGNCMVDANVNMVKLLVSQGTVTDPVRSSDLAVMAVPQTTSQRTSTAGCTVSRTTSTSQTCISEASTNTKYTLTRERHTNTPHTITRTLAVGDGKVCDQVRFLNKCIERNTITTGPPKVMTRDIGIGFTNINENTLIGLRTRNIACGPSRLPDPVKTRSIGVEVGDGRVRDAEGLQIYLQPEPGLDHYIDRMQRLLKEQQDLLTDSQPGSKNEVTLQSLGQLDTQVEVFGQGQTPKVDDRLNINQKNPMELQMSAALHGPTSDDRCLRSIMKRKNLHPKSTDGVNVPAPAPRRDVGDSRDEENKNGEKKQKEGSAKVKISKKERYKFSEKMQSACQILEVNLRGSKIISNRELRSSLNTVQQEWFYVSSQKRACPNIVEDFLFACRLVSPDVLCYVANMADQNGNTALHYSVSHSNFSVVKILLAAGVCNVDHQNRAGYTPIMLASLAAVETKEDMMVVQDLFSKGDVNAKASQAGQTALMLAVSHGRINMVRALLAAGAEVNIQDDEGSTALMCAGEHGHADIVKLLLAQPGCDATLTDNDDSTALSIALEAGHKDIAMLLYAHVNYSKGSSNTMGSPRSKTPPRTNSSD
nr:KN motif and ankyrin repeat domain-containing protein 1b [Misgurnus anguillicaudatus]XP_055055527.1 KN motif and ankyrin repeat domain-containing protein 1b [Misgurnus anguillicaudatus]XP_055055529.1 KN motif and ankyrin repeat domain-containing protein 1b [Misgurnus anguillicaudatus]XP_055055530.1 KN motif and ankyrin repeat domain-containing protein 1b [Misgurnus anguillicaudatus]XP_055055531.1 KN motif and ankyrin repeat domain-containing protein 1b [Misgurnus anguillicaudatus]XP_0550555